MKIVAYGLFLIGCGAAFAAGDSTPVAAASFSSTEPAWEWGEFSFLGGIFDAHPKVNIMIVTELTNVGRAQPEASAAHPVYFAGADGGLTLRGDLVGGLHPPKPTELARLMTRSLRSGGYLPADAAHPPSIYIYYSWGSFYNLRKGRHSQLQEQINFERAALVGGTKFALAWGSAMEMRDAGDAQSFEQFTRTSPEATYLVSLASTNLYFLVATACDYRAAVQGKLVILWQTRLSSEARATYMDESLPLMVVNAGSYIGHETHGPVRLNRPAVMEGDVEIGTPYEVADDAVSGGTGAFPATKSVLPPRYSPAAN